MPESPESRPGRYFAFIRAINTGGRRLTNEQILEPFHGLGFTDVAAYQAAGNVTFRVPDDPPFDLGRLENALNAAYGFSAPTFVRNAKEIAQLLSVEPFSPREVSRTEGRLQVCLLRWVPDGETESQLMDLVPGEDLLVVSGSAFFWLPKTTISSSELPVAAVEALLGEMTIRSHGTLSRMAARYTD